MEDEQQLQAFLSDFAEMKGARVLVHGGGIMATQLSEQLGYPTTMLDGRRITDENALKVILMTYAGLLNKRLVAGLLAKETPALGLCGADGGSVISRKREATPIDYGYVGDVEEINTNFITSLLEQSMVPVFSAITCTRDGMLLNTNADSMATEIARALATKFEVHLYFCMEKKGVLLDISDDASILRHLNRETYQELLAEGKITDGMLPKLHNCFRAIEGEVSAVYLGNAGLIRKESEGTKITS